MLVSPADPRFKIVKSMTHGDMALPTAGNVTGFKAVRRAAGNAGRFQGWTYKNGKQVFSSHDSAEKAAIWVYQQEHEPVAKSPEPGHSSDCKREPAHCLFP